MSELKYKVGDRVEVYFEVGEKWVEGEVVNIDNLPTQIPYRVATQDDFSVGMWFSPSQVRDLPTHLKYAIGDTVQTSLDSSYFKVIATSPRGNRDPNEHCYHCKRTMDGGSAHWVWAKESEIISKRESPATPEPIYTVGDKVKLNASATEQATGICETMLGSMRGQEYTVKSVRWSDHDDRYWELQLDECFIGFSFKESQLDPVPSPRPEYPVGTKVQGFCGDTHGWHNGEVTRFNSMDPSERRHFIEFKNHPRMWLRDHEIRPMPNPTPAPTDTYDGSYWMVMGSDKPTYKHRTESSARTEAERLAKLCPGQTFVVLHAVATVAATSVEWTDLITQEIPF